MIIRPGSSLLSATFSTGRSGHRVLPAFSFPFPSSIFRSNPRFSLGLGRGRGLNLLLRRPSPTPTNINLHQHLSPKLKPSRLSNSASIALTLALGFGLPLLLPFYPTTTTILLDSPSQSSPSPSPSSPPHLIPTPQTLKNLTLGSLLGLFAGLLISAFSRTLCLLFGVSVVAAQYTAAKGWWKWKLLPEPEARGSFQRGLRGLGDWMRRDVAFKVAFGVSCGVAGWGEF